MNRHGNLVTRASSTSAALLLVLSLTLLPAGSAHAEGKGGGAHPGKGGGRGGRVAARPLVVGTKPGFPGRPFPGRGALAVGVQPGVWGGYGYGYGDPAYGFGFNGLGVGGLGVGGLGFGGVGFGGVGFGGAYGYGWSEGTLLYRLGHIPVPPYYALHPPVYYGQRIYRTYGDSPYADYPYRRAYRQPAPPQMITNPLVGVVPVSRNQGQAAPAEQVAGTTKPLAGMIINPFYEATADSGQERANETVARRE